MILRGENFVCLCLEAYCIPFVNGWFVQKHYFICGVRSIEMRQSEMSGMWDIQVSGSLH